MFNPLPGWIKVQDRMNELGKLLIFLGAGLVLLGVVFILAGKVPWMGRLPGDIFIRRENFSLYFPITTGILLSILLSVIMYFFNKR